MATNVNKSRRYTSGEDMAGDAWRVVSFSIYGACLVSLYLASMFYHAFRAPRLKRIFRVFDHVAIFLLIAGTYTPIALVSLGGGGVAYTGGVAFYLWKRLPYNHAIWHLFVLGGSVCHFFAFLLYVL